MHFLFVSMNGLNPLNRFNVMRHVNTRVSFKNADDAMFTLQKVDAGIALECVGAHEHMARLVMNVEDLVEGLPCRQLDGIRPATIAAQSDPSLVDVDIKDLLGDSTDVPPKELVCPTCGSVLAQMTMQLRGPDEERSVVRKCTNKACSFRVVV